LAAVRGYIAETTLRITALAFLAALSGATRRIAGATVAHIVAQIFTIATTAGGRGSVAGSTARAAVARRIQSSAGSVAAALATGATVVATDRRTVITGEPAHAISAGRCGVGYGGGTDVATGAAVVDIGVQVGLAAIVGIAVTIAKARVAGEAAGAIAGRCGVR
jgi:hypothetical protein